MYFLSEALMLKDWATLVLFINYYLWANSTKSNRVHLLTEQMQCFIKI